MVELVGPPLTLGGPIPPGSLGAGLASADIHLSDELPELQTEFRRRIDLVNRLAAEMGIPLVDFDPTPIWYVETGDYEKMSSLFLAMRDAGFYLNGSAFPVVPHGHAGLRFTVTLYNSPEQIEAMLTALSEQMSELVGEPEIIIDLTAEIDVGRESRHGDGNPQ
jgi:pentatricopeptide repeat protein